jgi:membrane protein DedA with SNARE-associated domain
MDLTSLIATYGYWILAAGCLLEGETILALAGFAAHQGHLDLGAVIAIAALAGFAGDQFYFWLGRRHGDAVLRRFPKAAAQTRRVHRLLERWHAWVIVGIRFAYGLRIAGPILLGTMPIEHWRFVLFNAIGAALWAALIATLGWSFGRAVESVLGEVHRFEEWLFVAIAVAGVLAWAVHRWRRDNAGKRE